MPDTVSDSTRAERTRHHGEFETFNGRTGTVIVLPNRAFPGVYFIVYRIYKEYNRLTRQWLELADTTAHFSDGTCIGRVGDYKTMLELTEAYRAYWRRQREYELQQPDAHLEQDYEDRVSGSNVWFEDE